MVDNCKSNLDMNDVVLEMWLLRVCFVCIYRVAMMFSCVYCYCGTSGLSWCQKESFSLEISGYGIWKVIFLHLELQLTLDKCEIVVEIDLCLRQVLVASVAFLSLSADIPWSLLGWQDVMQTMSVFLICEILVLKTVPVFVTCNNIWFTKNLWHWIGTV